MTIPRIGDKIVRVRNSVPQESMEQIIPNNEVSPESDAVFEDADLSEFEDASLDDMFGDEPQAQEQTEQVAETEPTPAPVINNRHPEDSYSIEKFTQDYMEKLHGEVLPLLAQYEPERKQSLILAILVCGLFVITATLILFAGFENNGNIAIGLYSLAGFTWFIIKKTLEKKVKKKVMPVLMKAIPDFYWQIEPPIPEEDITDSKIFSHAKEAAKRFDDSFLGKYRGVDIAVAECNYVAGKLNIFNGAVIRLQMNKDFAGTTVIRPKKEVEVKDVNDLKKLKYQKVELEDIEFNKTYNVYSTDQVEARYLLTTAFVERFQNINMAFDSKVAFCAFSGKYVYIAPYCKKDLFSVCSLMKNVADEQQFVKLFNELTSILALVDHFKLDKKLGL